MQVNDIGAVTVVRLHDDEVRDGPSIQAMRQELYHLVDAGRRQFAIDFGDVKHLVASAVIALLLNLRNRLKEVEGTLTLHSLNPQVQEIFQVTRLDTLFDIRKEPAPAAPTHLSPPPSIG